MELGFQLKAHRGYFSQNVNNSLVKASWQQLTPQTHIFPSKLCIFSPLKFWPRQNTNTFLAKAQIERLLTTLMTQTQLWQKSI